jgi:glycosyltransferase involved in cell wall biosynthesis
MRILHWCPYFLTGGGVANAVRGLATAQAQLGCEVAIAAIVPATPPLYEKMETDGVTIIQWEPAWHIGREHFVLHGISRKAVQSFRRWKPDIVHVHGEYNPSNLWARYIFKASILLSPHGAFHPEVFAKGQKVAKQFYWQIAKHLLYSRVKGIHALSPMETEHIAKLLPASYVYCVSQGPNLKSLNHIARQTSKGNDEPIKLLFVGRLDVKTKGLDILVEALAVAIKELTHRNVSLMLVGPDWRGGRSWLQRRAEKLDIAHHVSFTGSMASRETRELLHGADIYIQLSRHEGFPLSVAEALLANKPAILSNAIGTVSYTEISRLPHVTVVPPYVAHAAAAIVNTIANVNRLKEHAVTAQREVQEFFSWERAAREHINVYKGLIHAAH